MCWLIIHQNLLDEKPEFESQARHQNEIEKVFFRRFPLRRKKLIFSDEAHFDLFFFENEQGKAVTVNGDRYWAMLNKFFSQKFRRRILATFGFNRTALRATKPKLYSMFCALFLKIALSAAELMSQSCDLTPLVYYLWGAVKDKYYVDKPETIDALKDN